MKKKLDIIFSKLIASDALKKTLSLTPVEVIEIIKESELRGRGGAGFLTGLKWELASQGDATNRYIVCNADEGEPGTFKDRKILDDQSQKVIEAMIIAGYAVGATNGFIYLRGEYRYLKTKIETELARFREKGWLGNAILQKQQFSFEITVRVGAGAYICGEDTALLQSLESRRGEPRNKPPFPVTQGYLGAPTVVNNVETLSLIPHIIINGAKWFHETGTPLSVGSKLFSVSGDCEKQGIYEFAFGVTIKELLKEVGANGITKAVQIGGAGGFCAARDDFDKSISFEGIPTGGSIIIFDESRNMLTVLKNFMEFFKNESCGQCTPCREGCARIVEGLEQFERGIATSKNLDDLLKLCETMQLASKCGLGQSVPNSFRSIVEKFKGEFIIK